MKDIDTTDILTIVVVQFDPRLIWSPGGEWFDLKYLKIFTKANSVGCRISHENQTAKIIFQLLDEMFQECSAQEPAYELLTKAKLLTILSNIARFFHSNFEDTPESVPAKKNLSRMEDSMNYIHEHLAEHLTLDTLAKEACMSRTYYSTTFKTLNGISVWDYITLQRIDRAQHLLETTDKTIIEISEKCGFNSTANFNRAFKRLSGQTPREYRGAARTPKNN